MLLPEVIEINPDQALEKSSQGALFVDVREQDELDQASYDVKDLIHIPLGTFEQRYTELPQDRDIVLVCRSGGRSLRAARFMMAKGYNRVFNLQHGIIHWIQCGKPIIGKAEAVLPPRHP